MRISIDRDGCIGSGQCALTAPDVFAQDDVGIVYVLPGGAEEAENRLIRQAELACPVQAIAVVED
ncbi:ferredoxin [Streptomyces sp. DSM 15324]|uniref:ferredoxin n=1 Tax=Streptomyces sp. DSM 15324 TaxID=1739111 RepID=UPI000746EDA4|nr:ferredoxin [Streptomyces sp. DSM 15324]KUO08886.1 ferredoxin [Streptomyces sp. DSM 15324]